MASQPHVIRAMVKTFAELVTSKPPTAKEAAHAITAMAMLGLLGSPPQLMALGGE